MRLKRGHFRPPKVTQKGVQKWTPLGDPLTRGTPKLISASWTRILIDFGTFPDSQKVVILAIFGFFVIFDDFFPENHDFQP